MVSRMKNTSEFLENLFFSNEINIYDAPYSTGFLIMSVRALYASRTINFRPESLVCNL